MGRIPDLPCDIDNSPVDQFLKCVFIQPICAAHDNASLFHQVSESNTYFADLIFMT